MRPILSTALILSLSASLAGCSWDPGFMPGGYTHHNAGDSFRAPPGPEAPSIGYEYTKAQNEAHITAWRYAVRDLLLSAKAQGLVFPDTLFLKTDLDTSAFQGSFDHILREGLREYDYVFSETPEGAAEIFYTAYEVEKPTHNNDADATLQNFDTVKVDLVIGLVKNGEIARGIRGVYDLPSDGFTSGKYVPNNKHPLKKNFNED